MRLVSSRGLLRPVRSLPCSAQTLAPRSAVAPSILLPLALEGSSLQVNGLSAPIYSVRPTQVNAQIPSAVLPGPASVIVSVGASILPPVTLTIRPSAPGLFLLGQSRALVQNQDGAINGPDHPAPPGSIVTAYLTGQGALDLPIPSGSAGPLDPPIRAAAQLSATLGGQNADTFSGMTPGLVGVFQVNLRIPTLVPGDYPLAVGVGQAVSNTALITVGQQRRFLSPADSDRIWSLDPARSFLFCGDTTSLHNMDGTKPMGSELLLHLTRRHQMPLLNIVVCVDRGRFRVVADQSSHPHGFQHQNDSERRRGDRRCSLVIEDSGIVDASNQLPALGRCFRMLARQLREVNSDLRGGRVAATDVHFLGSA